MRFTLFVLALPFLASCTGKGGQAVEFEQRLRTHCGNAYSGTITSTDAADDDWRGQEIIVHVTCTPNAVRMPLHVGEDRSRTWVLTRDGETFELRHDHRHKDGSEDALTQYGGFSSDNSSGSRQNFPADDSTKALFDAEGIPVSKQNTWAMEVRPSHQMIAYEMSRPERFFRIEFDTSEPVPAPPPPWGAE